MGVQGQNKKVGRFELKGSCLNLPMGSLLVGWLPNVPATR